MSKPKVSFIVPCRNKEKHVEACVRSVLGQTYDESMEIVLSDQGSTDDTLGILNNLATSYNGKNKVRVLQCPHTELKGMAGLNQHLNWLHTQIEGELVIMCSADDLNHPERARLTVEAYDKFNPSYVNTCVEYKEHDGVTSGWTAGMTGDGWVDPVQNIAQMIGSSASSCWARDLFDKYGPMVGIESQDLLLPFFATIERGIYYIHVPLHAYIRHADENNTGLEGVMRAAEHNMKALEDKIAKADKENIDKLKGELENAKAAHLQSIELVNFHVTSNWYAIMRRVQTGDKILPDPLRDALLKAAIESGSSWAFVRDHLIMNRVQPARMKI